MNQDVENWRDIARPLEKGKLLYCFPFEGLTFVDLVCWSGPHTRGRASALKSLTRLFDAIREYRDIESRCRKQGKKASMSRKLARSIQISQAQIKATLDLHGDLAAGVEATNEWTPSEAVSPSPPLASTTRVTHKWHRGWLLRQLSMGTRTRRSLATAGSDHITPEAFRRGRRRSWRANSRWCEVVHQYYVETHPSQSRPTLAALDSLSEDMPTAQPNAANLLPPHQDHLDDDQSMTVAVAAPVRNGIVNRCVAYLHRAMRRWSTTLPPEVHIKSMACTSLSALVKLGKAEDLFIDLSRAESLRAANKLPPQDSTSALRDCVSDQPKLRYDKANTGVGSSRFQTLMDAIEAPSELRTCISEHVAFFSSRHSDDKHALEEQYGESPEERRQAACKVLAAVAVTRCLVDFLRRKGTMVCPDSMPHSLWFLERSAQGPFLVIKALLRRWRKRGDR